MANRPQKKKEVNDLYNLMKGLRDQIGLIWLTMVGYIIYLEFFKETLQYNKKYLETVAGRMHVSTREKP